MRLLNTEFAASRNAPDLILSFHRGTYERFVPVAVIDEPWSALTRRPSTRSVHGGEPAVRFDLLRNLDGVIDFDAEVADGAFDLGMSKQKLDCPQIAGRR